MFEFEEIENLMKKVENLKVKDFRFENNHFIFGFTEGYNVFNGDIIDLKKLKKLVELFEKQNPKFEFDEEEKNKTNPKRENFTEEFDVISHDKFGHHILTIKAKSSLRKISGLDFLLCPKNVKMYEKEIDSSQIKKIAFLGFKEIFNDIIWVKIYPRTFPKSPSYTAKILDFSLPSQNEDSCSTKKNSIFYFLKEKKIHLLSLEKNTNKFDGICHLIDSFVYKIPPKNPMNGTKMILVFENFDCNLRDLIELRRENLKIYDEKMIVQITHNILIGITNLQRRSICHRNLKPENIVFCSKKQKYFIKDFGLAKKFKEPINWSASLIGSALYMPVEIFSKFSIKGGLINFQYYNEKIDIYSLGIIAVELVALTLSIRGLIPENSFYAFSDINSLKNLKDFLRLAELKLMIHNYSIFVLKKAKDCGVISEDFLWLLRSMIHENPNVRVNVFRALDEIKSILKNSKKILSHEEMDFKFCNFISKKFILDFESRVVEKRSHCDVITVQVQIYKDFKMYRKALNLLVIFKEFVEFQISSGVEELLEIDIEIVECRLELKELDLALHLLKSVENRIEKYPHENLIPKVLQLKAKLSYARGDSFGLFQSFFKLEKILNRKIFLGLKSRFYYEIKNFKECLEVIERTKAKFIENEIPNNFSKYLEILFLEACCYEKMNEVEKSLGKFKEILKIVGSSQMRNAVKHSCIVYSYLSFLESNLGNIDNSVVYAEKLENNIEKFEIKEDKIFGNILLNSLLSVVYARRAPNYAYSHQVKGILAVSGKIYERLRFEEKEVIVNFLRVSLTILGEDEKLILLLENFLDDLSKEMIFNHFKSIEIRLDLIKAQNRKMRFCDSEKNSKVNFLSLNSSKDYFKNYNYVFDVIISESEILKKKGFFEKSMDSLNKAEIWLSEIRRKRIKESKNLKILNLSILKIRTKKSILLRYQRKHKESFSLIENTLILLSIEYGDQEQIIEGNFKKKFIKAKQKMLREWLKSVSKIEKMELIMHEKSIKEKLTDYILNSKKILEIHLEILKSQLLPNLIQKRKLNPTQKKSKSKFVSMLIGSKTEKNDFDVEIEKIVKLQSLAQFTENKALNREIWEPLENVDIGSKLVQVKHFELVAYVYLRIGELKKSLKTVEKAVFLVKSIEKFELNPEMEFQFCSISGKVYYLQILIFLEMKPKKGKKNIDEFEEKIFEILKIAKNFFYEKIESKANLNILKTARILLQFSSLSLELKQTGYSNSFLQNCKNLLEPHKEILAHGDLYKELAKLNFQLEFYNNATDYSKKAQEVYKDCFGNSWSIFRQRESDYFKRIQNVKLY